MAAATACERYHPLHQQRGRGEEAARRTLIAVIEQRVGTALPAEVQGRVASANLVTLHGWLSDIILKNNMNSLFDTGPGNGSPKNGAGEHAKNGVEKPPKS